jgi:hypothetical protein
MTKTTHVSVQGRYVALRADRAFFVRALVLAQNRSMDLKKILSYDLGPLPLSLAKTAKSSLLHQLEKLGSSDISVPDDAVTVVDGMAVLQSIVKPPSTLGNLVKTVFNVVQPHCRLLAHGLTLYGTPILISTSSLRNVCLVPHREYSL